MFKKIYFPVLILISVFLFSACDEDNPTEPGDSNVSTPSPTLSSIQANVFTPGCAFANCHGNSGTQANLHLTNGQPFGNLVGVDSQLFPSSKRVEAGDGSNSILIKILKGQVSPQMPQNRAKLSDAIIDSIAKWIDNGALNN
jgi:cytochrome c553